MVTDVCLNNDMTFQEHVYVLLTVHQETSPKRKQLTLHFNSVSAVFRLNITVTWSHNLLIKHAHRGQFVCITIRKLLVFTSQYDNATRSETFWVQGNFGEQNPGNAYINSNQTSHKTHCVFITKTNQLMLCTEITAVCWENYTEHTNILLELNAVSLTLKKLVHIVTTAL